MRLLTVIGLAIAVAACGGGEPSANSPADRLLNGGTRTGGDGDGGGGGDDGGGGGGTVDPQERVVKIGSGTGDSFNEGVLATTRTTLEAGGSTTITVNLVNADNSAVTEPIPVHFASDCYANALASFEVGEGESEGESADVVVTVAGRASAVYTAEGCSGTDEVVVSAEIDGSVIRARIELTIEADAVLSVQYEGATSSFLALAGMGGIETTRLTFRLVGAQGSPIRDEEVAFTLSTTQGGVRFAEGTETAVSNDKGRVSTVLQTGTVSTPVRITATHSATGKFGISEHITISTGVPVADNFSFALETYNPLGAYRTIGMDIGVTLIAEDQFGHPAPDGTRIVVVTPESGMMSAPYCETEGGICELDWISTEKRPIDGRVSLMAYTVGAEAFVDTNGNRIFDVHDSVWTDVSPEPCLDENENGLCEPDAGEFFVDADADGEYYGPHGDGIWNGPCLSGTNPDAHCPEPDGVTLARVRTLVLSTDHAEIVEQGTFPLEGSTIVLGSDPVSFSGMFIGDSNGNSLPAETTITFSTSNGTLGAPNSWTVPVNVTEPFGPLSVTLRPDNTSGETGTLTLRVEVSDPAVPPREWSWTVTD